MADSDRMKGSGRICDDRCGCPSPCPGGGSCGCADPTAIVHNQCSCGSHCGCNPCSCSSTNVVTGTGKAFCKCGSGCTCPTCTT